MKGKVTILLYDLVQPALILLAETGIVYRNQTAGTCCFQQEEEGILVPVPVALIEDVSREIWDAEEITGKRADFIDSCWSRLNEEYRAPKLMMDRARLRYSQEAWLRVLLGEPIYPGGPERAVLTWSNSD